MMKTFASALVAAALLGGAATAAYASSSSDSVDLWSGPNQSGDSMNVQAPTGGGCVQVGSNLQTGSITNNSAFYVAYPYTDSFCGGNGGDALAAVSSGQTMDLGPGYSIGSIRFMKHS